MGAPPPRTRPLLPNPRGSSTTTQPTVCIRVLGPAPPTALQPVSNRQNLSPNYFSNRYRGGGGGVNLGPGRIMFAQIMSQLILSRP